MGLVESLLKAIDSEAIFGLAKEAVNSWASEDGENRELLLSSDLVFKSNKFCFESSLVNYPYFETTYEFVKEDEELGLYRIFTSLEGEAIDDYYEIY